MVKFCGLFVSDHRHVRCALASVGKTWDKCEGQRSWVGMGYYSGGEVLLMKRHGWPEGGAFEMLGPAPGNHVIIGISDDLMRSDLEHIPPFRFRHYLGVVSIEHTDDLLKKVTDHMPPHLVRNLPPYASAEAIFRLFLSYLYDMGRLNDFSVSPSVLTEAARSTMCLLTTLINRPQAALCITNGMHLVAACTGTDLFVYRKQEIFACPLCSEPERTQRHDPAYVDHRSVKVIAFVHPDMGDGDFVKVIRDRVVTATSSGELLESEILRG